MTLLNLHHYMDSMTKVQNDTHSLGRKGQFIQTPGQKYKIIGICIEVYI